MTNLLEHNNDVILLEQFDIWNELVDDRPIDIIRLEYDMKPREWKEWCLENRPDVDAMEQYRIRRDETKAARIKKEVAECCKPITRFDPATGTLYEIKSRRCKRYEHCEICKKWKREQEYNIMVDLVGKTRFIEVDAEDEANLVRKYGSDNVRRVPIGKDRTAIIIQTDDEVGREFSMNDCRRLSRHAVPTDNRRVSGKLGTQVIAEKSEEIVLDWDEIEKEINDPEIELSLREMDISYDSEDKAAPKNIKELQTIVEAETDITRSPENEKELREAVNKCELKVQEICIRFSMSFNFFRKTLINIRLSEVDWKWSKFETSQKRE